MKRYLCLAGFMILSGIFAASVFGANQIKLRDFRLERSMSEAARACLECHKQEHPGIFTDWAESRHANANITCIDCHLADETDPDISETHYKQYQRDDTPWGRAEYRVPIAEVVTPKDCSRCHPDEVTEYSRSKHAHTVEIMWKIDPWLNKGMNSDTERQAGCYYCHGTVCGFRSNPATDSAAKWSTRSGTNWSRHSALKWSTDSVPNWATFS